MEKRTRKRPFPFGERFESASVARVSFTNDDNLALSKWIKNPQHFLILSSNPGPGKTYFCAALWNYYDEKYKLAEFSMRFWNEKDLFAKLRTDMDATDGDWSTNLKFLIDDDLVFYDDFGAVSYTDWRKDVLFDFIDYRYNSMKPTIITTNLTSDAIYKKFDERFHSRITASENIFLEMNLKDKRKEGK